MNDGLLLSLLWTIPWLMSFGPSIIAGVVYRSWRRAVIVLATSHVVPVAVVLLLILTIEIFIRPTGEAAEGYGALALGIGTMGGWVLGAAAPFVYFRALDRGKTDSPAPGLGKPKARLRAALAAQDATIRAARSSSLRSDPFEYATFTFEELRDTALRIDRDAYPERASKIEREIEARLRAAREGGAKEG